jgi:hypothetical protein
VAERVAEVAADEGGKALRAEDLADEGGDGALPVGPRDGDDGGAGEPRRELDLAHDGDAARLRGLDDGERRDAR